MKSLKNRIICAIDNIDHKDISGAMSLIDEIHEDVGAIKLGMEFFYAFGQNGLRKINETFPNLPIFLDLKLHDIPNTVSKAIRTFDDIGNIIFFTIHAHGGEKMIRSAIEALAIHHKDALISPVTRLTSSEGDIESDVLKYAQIAQSCGAKALVAPAEFANQIKSSDCGKDLIIISPGIRLNDSSIAQDDQIKTMTPSKAIALGVDYLVIGRPITGLESKKEKINLLRSLTQLMG